MKQIIILIRPHMYFKTKDRLAEKGFCYLSGTNVVGRGKKLIKPEIVDDARHEEKEIADLVMTSKRMMEIFARDEDVDAIIQTVLDVNRNGNPGDGKIFVLPCDNAVRVRTHETGEDAII